MASLDCSPQKHFKSDDGGEPHLFSLPSDMLCEIASKLRPRDLPSFALSCKSAAAVVNSNIHWNMRLVHELTNGAREIACESHQLRLEKSDNDSARERYRRLWKAGNAVVTGKLLDVAFPFYFEKAPMRISGVVKMIDARMTGGDQSSYVNAKTLKRSIECECVRKESLHEHGLIRIFTWSPAVVNRTYIIDTLYAHADAAIKRHFDTIDVYNRSIDDIKAASLLSAVFDPHNASSVTTFVSTKSEVCPSRLYECLGNGATPKLIDVSLVDKIVATFDQQSRILYFVASIIFGDIRTYSPSYFSFLGHRLNNSNRLSFSNGAWNDAVAYFGNTWNIVDIMATPAGHLVLLDSLNRVVHFVTNYGAYITNVRLASSKCDPQGSEMFGKLYHFAESNTIIAVLDKSAFSISYSY